MERSESISNIAAALAKAQGEMRAPEKDRTVRVAMKNGGSYEFAYATLDAVIAAARGPLAANGIAWIQSPDVKGSTVTVETLLAHESGEWVANRLVMSAADPFPQSVGSAISYAKRYALSAMLGLVAEEDDDANAAERNAAEQKKKPRKVTEQAPAVAPQVESASAAWSAAEAALVDAGVVAANESHPERAAYLSWVRNSYAQVLGQDVPKVASLDAAKIRSGASTIAKLIKDGSIEAWKPREPQKEGSTDGE